MVIIDLQWLLFFLLCALLAVAGVAILWGDHWLPRTRRMATVAGQDLGVLEHAPVGLLLLEEDAVRYANQSARHILHLGDAAVGQPLPRADWTDLLEVDRAAARLGTSQDVVPARASSAAGGLTRAHPGEAANGMPTGRFRNLTFATGTTVRWWVSPQGRLDVIVLLDISAQHRARQASRSLLSDLGHELRTPVATLLTHLEILGFEDVNEDVRHQSLHLSKREAQRMSRLVDDILELGRLEATEVLAFRPLNFLTLVEEAVAQVAPVARELAISVEVTSDSALPLVEGHADRLRQVMLNLLDNALKYAGRGARVAVTLERISEGVRCSVIDTGPGIPAEHLPHLAQRFYRAGKDSGEGSGLGLALVQGILQRHDSTLEIESPVSEGRGACFRFILPTVQQGEERAL